MTPQPVTQIAEQFKRQLATQLLAALELGRFSKDMDVLYKWVESRRKSIYFLLAILGLSYILPFISSNKYIIISAASATLIIPFLLLVVAITGGDFYKTVIKQKWVATIVSLALAFYTALANIYAASVINDVFQVNSGLFPLTTIFLTFAYFIVTYLKWIVFIPYIAFFVAGGFIGILIIVIGGGWLIVTKRLAVLSIVGIFLSATNASVSMFERNIPSLVKNIAVKSDFSSKHRCGDFGRVPVKSVIFMPSGSVFALLEKNINGVLHWDFDVIPCKAER